MKISTQKIHSGLGSTFPTRPFLSKGKIGLKKGLKMHDFSHFSGIFYLDSKKAG